MMNPTDLREYPAWSRLSERAQGMLKDVGARVDPSMRAGGEALSREFKERGLSINDTLIEVEHVYAGLTSRIITISPLLFLRRNLTPTSSGETTVLIAESYHGLEGFGAIGYFLGPSGTICRKRRDRRSSLTAGWESLLLVLEKLALLRDVVPLPQETVLLVFQPRVGESIAAALRAPLVREATDRFHSFWCRDGLLICDGHPYIDNADDQTRVWTRSIADAAAAVESARRASPRLRAAATARAQTRDLLSPDQAPPLSSISGWRHPRSVPLLSDDTAIDGRLWARGAADESGPAVEQTHEHRGALLRWDTYSTETLRDRDFTLAVKALKPLLTERAGAWLEHLRPRRDPSRTRARAEVSARLKELSLPIFESVLDLEEHLGGLFIGGLELGVYRALAWCDQPPPPNTFGQTMLLPITPPSRSGTDENYAVDADGTIYFCVNDFDAIAPVSSSWRVFLDRYCRSCVRRSIPQGAGSLELPFWASAPSLIGGALARALSATMVQEATDAYESTWERSGLEIAERRVTLVEYGIIPQTEVSCGSADDLVAAIKAVLEIEPEAKLWVRIPENAVADLAESQGEPVAVRLPQWDSMGRRLGGEVIAFGRPGHFRFVIPRLRGR